METAFLAEIATIVGAVSILLTLVFVVIELKNNATQARAANIASRDQQHSQFMRYWFEEENFALVQKGRKNYGALDDTEKQKFEYYIDERVRMFSFSLSTGQVSFTSQFHYKRIKEFLNIRAPSNATNI